MFKKGDRFRDKAMGLEAVRNVILYALDCCRSIVNGAGLAKAAKST